MDVPLGFVYIVLCLTTTLAISLCSIKQRFSFIAMSLLFYRLSLEIHSITIIRKSRYGLVAGSAHSHPTLASGILELNTKCVGYRHVYLLLKMNLHCFLTKRNSSKISI